MIDNLQKLEKDYIIEDPTHYRLYPGEAISCIYCLPKINKDGAPFRPIVSVVNTAKYLSHILSSTDSWHNIG